MDGSQAAQLLDGLTLLLTTLRFSVDLAVFAFAYWQVVH